MQLAAGLIESGPQWVVNAHALKVHLPPDASRCPKRVLLGLSIDAPQEERALA
jgi:hypothetical protein